MKPADVYIDLDGQELVFAGLDPGERRLIARLRRRAHTNPDWNDFDNYWTAVVPAFYQTRGLPRKAVPRTIPWRVAQDLSSRLGITAGLVRLGDYRDEMEDLIHEKFQTRRAFCEATGLSEDMLCHVLAGRKDLSLAALNKALERIGYRLRIVPAPDVKVAARARKQTG